MVAGSHRGVFVSCFKASFNGKPKSQLAVWKVAGKTTPIMETKLASLTENETNLLVHFADGTTQEWLMLHIEKPEASK